VLRKLLWYRLGGEVSEKQWRDVVEVLKVGGPQLSLAYLDSWGARLTPAATRGLERHASCLPFAPIDGQDDRMLLARAPNRDSDSCPLPMGGAPREPR